MLFGVVMLSGLAADVVTKSIMVARLDAEFPVRLLGGLLTLRLLRNSGAAFSQGQRFTYIFAVAAIAVLAFVLIRLVPQLRHRGWAIALGLLCAGVSGNLVDRIFRRPGVLRGHVVDFLQLPYFAIFNVADICITTSAALIIYWSVIKGIGLDGEHATHPPAKQRARRGT